MGLIMIAALVIGGVISGVLVPIMVMDGISLLVADPPEKAVAFPTRLLMVMLESAEDKSGIDEGVDSGWPPASLAGMAEPTP